MSELYESEMTEDEVISLIKRDCKPFLSMKPYALLMRGMKKANYPFKQSVRTDRKPLDTPDETHDQYNKWFKELFGINARSECVFVTSSFFIANAYVRLNKGNVYAVFPIGEMKYIWSPLVDDLVDLLDDEMTFDEFKELDYKMTGLNSAIEHRNEIMIKCNEYYAIPIASAEDGRDLYEKIFD
jgi:hypothetical protein